MLTHLCASSSFFCFWGAFRMRMRMRVWRKVAAEILKSLKTSVESYLQEEVKEAVVSVPAYFGPTEREATERAANIAGLTLLR